MGISLRLVLGDQLNHHHSWFTEINPEVVYVLMEMKQETAYVLHHQQKIACFFEAMRRFASHIKSKGHRVHYLHINDEENQQKLSTNIAWLINHYQASKFEYQLPDEYRLDKELKALEQSLNVPVNAVDTEHFLSSRKDLEEQLASKKQVLMESFYRSMRKRYGILMDAPDKPKGGKWNYDAENRKPYKGKEALPAHNHPRNKLSQLKEDMVKAGLNYFGEMPEDTVFWPLDREQALQVLQDFIQHGLPYFGTYQDAMKTGNDFLFHSRLSFALNVKLLHPMEVIKAAEEAHQRSPAVYSLAGTEGFIRQILGWREFVRGIYWWKMPEYGESNFFGHTRELPTWYWTGETKMHCLKECIKGSLNNAYAHHIQRLMVTGNFALLAGIHPTAVDAWYLGIYIDAIEWVEMPNTRGMSQFADGGFLGTKPYVSTANYIDKMSDYCGQCQYDKKLKTGAKACPFNSLYWHFYERNRTLLEKNPRIGMMYQLLNKMDTNEKQKILSHAEGLLQNLDKL